MSEQLIPALSVENLSKTYSNGFVALNSISLTVKPGDFFSLLGPNGAGKSTLINIICGLLKKSAGKASVFGCDLDNDSFNIKRNIGLVPQEVNFNRCEKPIEILVNQAGFHGIDYKKAKQKAQSLLTKFDLLSKKNEVSNNLSGGMKRRLMIVRALMTDPKLLILDEPTAGVDIEARYRMWDYLKEVNKLGVTIILTTHHLEEAEVLCNRFAVINKGAIVENCNMATLNNKCIKEDIFIQTRDPLPKDLILTEFVFNRLGDTAFEVTLNEQQNLNDLLQALQRHHIQIVSVRNKTNRLEALFLNLIKDKSKTAESEIV